MRVLAIDEQEPVHEWFELTYASYLVLPRSVLQAMPASWQLRFVGCLRELEEAFARVPEVGHYEVHLRDQETGRFVRDPLSEYRRPDLAAIERVRRTGQPQGAA